MTAATGVAVGLGALGLALLGFILAWVVLGLLGLVSARIHRRNPTSADVAER